MKQKVVIAGLGDTGVLTAIHLASEFNVVGISPKPGLVSGQELGLRLTRPDRWRRDYLVPFERYKGLDEVRTVHGVIGALDKSAQRITVRRADGTIEVLKYDALVVATGVASGFWREPSIEDLQSIQDGITANYERAQSATSIAVVGAGPSGVSTARNIAKMPSTRDVHLFSAHELVLKGYHLRVREHATRLLEASGVQIHNNHRAVIPPTLDESRWTTEPIEWATGQPAFSVDLALWTTGQVSPNTGFMPRELLTDSGFVRVDPTLRVAGTENIFAIGDVAATDPNRSSARNWAYKILVHNIREHLKSSGASMREFKAPKHRWGSIFGPTDDDGFRVFFENGRSMRVPAWFERNFLTPVVTKRIIYKGIRQAEDD